MDTDSQLQGRRDVSFPGGLPSTRVCHRFCSVKVYRNIIKMFEMYPKKIAGGDPTIYLSPSGDKLLIHLAMRVQFLEDAKAAPCINVSIQAEYGQPTRSDIQRTLIKIDSSRRSSGALCPARFALSHRTYSTHGTICRSKSKSTFHGYVDWVRGSELVSPSGIKSPAFSSGVPLVRPRRPPASSSDFAHIGR